MPESFANSPLAHRRPIPAGDTSVVDISEIDTRAIFDLRARPDDEAAFAAIEAAIGSPLPRAPRSVTVDGERRVLWLSVDRWLITAPFGQRDDLAKSLGRAVEGRFACVCDVSDARATIRLAGANAREVVMKCASIDLKASGRGAGQVFRVGFAGTTAIIDIVAASPDVIDLLVARSYADHVWQWVASAARRSAELRLFAAQTAPPV